MRERSIHCLPILVLLLNGSSFANASDDDQKPNIRRLGSNHRTMTTKSEQHTPNTIRGAEDRHLQLQDFDMPVRKRAPRFSKDNLKFSYDQAWRQHFLPSSSPSAAPSLSIAPSEVPSPPPSVSKAPSAAPSSSPSVSKAPSEVPSVSPSLSNAPSEAPTELPSASPSRAPTNVPSSLPSVSIAPSKAPSDAPSSSPSMTPIIVACLGDSLTRGVTGLWSFPGSDYPAQLQKLMGAPFQFYNYGRNSVTAMRGMSESYDITRNFQSGIELDADIYLIMLGTNDARHWQQAAHKFLPGLDWIVQQAARTPAKNRVILAIPPWVQRDNIGIKDDVIAKNVRPRILEVAAANKLQVVDMYNVTYYRNEFYTNDGVHLNARGYEALAQAWKKAILCDYAEVCYGKRCQYTCRNAKQLD